MQVTLPGRWKKRAPACLLPWRGIGSVTCAARGTEMAAWRDAAADLDERVDEPATMWPRPGARGEDVSR